MPVDIVFVGYEGQIDNAALLGDLPATYTPIVRYPAFYGLQGRDTGLKFTFEYTVSHASQSFEDKFFSFLAHAGTEGPLTLFQDQYNQQRKNVLDVVGPVLYIDGPTVERYLSNPDWVRQGGYTIYFINWYARSDFWQVARGVPGVGFPPGRNVGAAGLLAGGGGSPADRRLDTNTRRRASNAQHSDTAHRLPHDFWHQVVDSQRVGH